MNNHIRRLFFGAVLPLLFLTFFYQIASGQGWGKVTAEEWKLGPPSDYPEANAVVIFDRGTLKVMLETIKFTRHVRMKVLTKAGIDEIGDVEFTYDNEDKITSLDAQTITPDGKKHKVEKKDFYTKSAGGSKVKSFSFPALDSGCIVEYSYTNMNQRHHRIDPWFFQGGLYMLSSEYNLILEAGFTYSSATIKVPPAAQKPVEEFLPNTENIGDPPFKSFTWTMSNLPPIKSEPYMSFSRNYMASIYNQLVSYKNAYFSYTYVQNWSDLGQRFQESVDQYVNDKKKIRELVDSLTSTHNEKKEKALVLYDYVLKEINTRDDDDGHWYAHDKLSELLQERSGTEDEKNILYVEMLKAAGIPAWPVLIGRRGRNVFMPQLFQMHQFDHIIALANIDSSSLYLDTESKYCPFGILPPESRSNGGLQVDAKNSQVTKVAMINPETSRIEKTKMYIAGDGSVACTTMVKYKGYYAAENGELYENKKPEDFVKEYFLEKLGTTYVLDTPSFYQESPDMLQMNISYKLDNYARRLDKNLLVKPVCYHFRENPFKSRKRSFPVDFNYPFVYQNTVEIHSNDSLESYSVPQPLTISIPGATFSRNCMYDGIKIIVDSRLVVERPIFLPDLYEQLRDFFTKVASASDEEVVLTGGGN